MLDHRFETFLTLCRLGSFTRTAGLLPGQADENAGHDKLADGTGGSKNQGSRVRVLPGQQLLKMGRIGVHDGGVAA